MTAGAYGNGAVRIAEVLGYTETGGVMSWLMNYYRRIDRSKIDVDFYMYSPSPYDGEIRASGGRVFYYPRVTNVLGAYRTLKRAFKENVYDAVHVHMTTLSFVALCAARSASVGRRICHAHSTANRGEGWKWAVKTLIRPLNKLFATEYAGCSEESIRWLYGAKSAESAILIHNAVDLSRFLPEAPEVAASDHAGGEKIKTIGFIGRFERQKNVGFLIDVFKKITEKRDDVRLLLAGAGSEEGALKEKVGKLGLGLRVEFCPWSGKVEKYYSAIDLLALPSLFEGLPLVAVEAQAAGIPCVLSENVTSEAAVTNNCVFAPLNDVGAWADALERALDAGRDYGEALKLKGGDYDIDAEADKLEKYYLNGAKGNGRNE